MTVTLSSFHIAAASLDLTLLAAIEKATLMLVVAAGGLTGASVTLYEIWHLAARILKAIRRHASEARP